MAREVYRRVVPRFWGDPDIKRRLDLAQKAFLLYLMTNPHSHPAGIYSLPLVFIQDELGFSPEEALGMLLGPVSGFATYDPRTEEVFVHKMSLHQFGGILPRGDNRNRYIERQVVAIQSDWLVNTFLDAHQAWYFDVENLRRDPSDPPKTEAPYQGPSQAPYEAPSESVGGEQEKKPLHKPLTKGLGKPVSVSVSEAVSDTGEKRREPNGEDSAPSIPDLEAEASMGTQELVAFWIEHQTTRPPQEQIAKQGAVAKRLCEKHPRSQLVQAAVGITQLFPHAEPKNEPWDLFDLERKFAKCLEAAHNHPAAKWEAYKQELAGIDLATYGR